VSSPTNWIVPASQQQPIEEARQQRGPAQAGPVGLRQDAVVAGRGAHREVSDRAEHVADRTTTGGEDGGDHEEMDASEGGGGEGRGEEGQQGQGGVGYTGHEALLARDAWKFHSPPMIPPGRARFVADRSSSQPHQR